MPLILMLIGVFSIAAAIQNWDFFMNHRKARFVSMIVGRQGARVFYGVLGAVMIVAGGVFFANMP